MSQDTLFLLVVSIFGIYAIRWSLRLAPASSELPVKTTVATALAALVALEDVLGYSIGPQLRLLVLIGSPLFIFGPLLATALARGRRYGLARALGNLLYWGEGRHALGRLLAQAALQQGDVAKALQFSAQQADPLLLIQAHALQGEWYKVLDLTVPATSDNSFLADDARLQALIALGRLEEAHNLLQRVRARWEGQSRGQGPIGYRTVVLGEARLAAEEGRIDTVRDTLRNPLPGVPAHVIYGIYGRTAEQARRYEEAGALYAHAFSTAPEALRERYARKLEQLGRPVPKVVRRDSGRGTWALLGGLAMLYGLQLLLNNAGRTVLTRAGMLLPADAAAAFLLNIPGVAQADAAWRYLSYAFVHGNLVHIGFNLWVLFDLGRVYEARRGWGNLLAAFVFGSVMGAYLTEIAQARDVLLLVGASGGVLGVGGALLADTLRSHAPADRQLTRSLLQWIVLIVVFSIAIPNVSLWGHLGGLLGGLLWGFVRQGLPASGAVDRFAGGVSIGLLLFAFIRVTQLALTLLPPL
jgi:membrane associated rhomboid family serine protease